MIKERSFEGMQSDANCKCRDMQKNQQGTDNALFVGSCIAVNDDGSIYELQSEL